jgi:hypothetical protein
MFVVVPLSLVQILSIGAGCPYAIFKESHESFCIFKVHNDLLGGIVGWIDETNILFIVTTPKEPTVVVMELSTRGVEWNRCRLLVRQGHRRHRE